MMRRRDDDGDDDWLLLWLCVVALWMLALSGCASAPMPIIKERIVPCPITLPLGNCPDAAEAVIEDGDTLYTFYEKHLETWKAHRGCRLLVDAIRELHEDCGKRTQEN